MVGFVFFVFGTPPLSGPYLERYVEIRRRYHGKWGSSCKTIKFLIDFGCRFDAHGRRRVKIGGRHHGK